MAHSILAWSANNLNEKIIVIGANVNLRMKLAIPIKSHEGTVARLETRTNCVKKEVRSK